MLNTVLFQCNNPSIFSLKLTLVEKEKFLNFLPVTRGGRSFTMNVFRVKRKLKHVARTQNYGSYFHTLSLPPSPLSPVLLSFPFFISFSSYYFNKSAQM